MIPLRGVPHGFITLHVVCNPIVNFSVVQSLSSPIESVIIENHSDKTLENLELVADSATDLMVDSTFPCAGECWMVLNLN